MIDSAQTFVNSLFDNPLRAIATGLLVLFVYLYINRRKQIHDLKTRLNEEKQRFYIELFVFLNLIVRGKVVIADTDQMMKLIEYDSKLKLFSGDKVVLAWADFWRSIFLLSSKKQKVPEKSTIEILKAYGYLQWSIRKDIGSSSILSTLKWHDFSRSQINNLEDDLAINEKQFRTSEMKKDKDFLQTTKQSSQEP